MAKKKDAVKKDVEKKEEKVQPNMIDKTGNVNFTEA